jgi:replicative DNA helicase
MERLESIILRSLIYDEEYTRRVMPFLADTYFSDKTEHTIFSKLRDFVDKFKTVPTNEALIVDLSKTSGVGQDDFDEITTYLNALNREKGEKPNADWLVEQTESWCQEKAVHNAMLEALEILEDRKKQHLKGSIPKILQDALAVSFDPHVGHDYLLDADSRFDFYHKTEQRIPFHLDDFNRITKNGVPAKTLNVVLAGVGVGKSLYLCDLASSYLMQNKNVLYITMEMAEERIAERIDANLMDRPVDELQFMTKEGFDKQIQRINAKTQGQLIIKEYPTAQAHVGHFRHLMNELLLKKKFKPDVVFIDYLNICASSRMKIGAGGMYEFVKSIAEELRGFGVEFNVPVWTATQLNRAGFNNNDPDMTNTAESFGLPATADFMFALITDETLEKLNQLLVKILKNRYGSVNKRNTQTGNIMNRFVVGIDRSKMKLYNLDPSAQLDLNNEPAMPPATPPKAKPMLLNEGEDDTTPPWDDESTETAEPKMKTKQSDIVFDIDRTDTFNAAEEEAERRRISALHRSMAYKAGYNVFGRGGSKAKKELKT